MSRTVWLSKPVPEGHENPVRVPAATGLAVKEATQRPRRLDAPGALERPGDGDAEAGEKAATEPVIAIIIKTIRMLRR